MKLCKFALGVVALAISTSSLAGMVSTSSNLEFLAINGQKASKSILKEKKSFNAEANQTQQVVVRLGEIVGSGSSQALFESNPIIVTFQSPANDVVVSAEKIRSKEEGEKFNAQPQITVKTKSGNVIDAKIDTLKQEGLFPAANIVNDLAEYNASNAPAAVSALAVPAVGMMPIVSGKTMKGKVVVQGENIAEQQLQYWFQQADKETQTRFLNWAKKQK